MRWLRLLSALVFAKYRNKLSVNEISKLQFSVWLTDIDATIMNHASMMTVMEAGRIDYMVRTGFFKLARKEKWYFPTSAISVQFQRPLKIFQEATLTTQAIHFTATHIYLEQKIIRDKKEMARCLVKATVKKGRQTLDIPSIVSRLDDSPISIASPGLIESFEKHHNFLKEQNMV